MSSLSSYIQDFWSNHVAAVTASIWSLLSAASIIQSVVVGVSVFCITGVIKLIYAKITGK